MSMSEPWGVVVPCLYDSSGGYVMSLQKTSVPALWMEPGAGIEAATVAVVFAEFFLPPPQPAAARTTTSRTAAMLRDTAAPSLVGFTKIRLSNLFVLTKRRGIVRQRDPPRLEDVAAARDVERHQGVLLRKEGRSVLL